MISVIVPVYKVEPYLRQCVNSIVSQTTNNLEILLIDDGSPDQCGKICDEYEKQDHRVRVFHTENKGLSAARNLGIHEAQGDYISFVDADDWIEPDLYELLLKKIQENDADISICGYDVFSEDRIVEWILPAAVYEGESAMVALLNGQINSIVWNKLFRRELFQSILFPEGKNYEDIAVMHKVIAQARRVDVISISKYHYRIRSDSISKIYTAKNLIDYADAHISRCIFYIDEKPELSSGLTEIVLLFAAKGISRVWRWWYGCSVKDKKQYAEKIEALRQFSIEHFPLFGCCSWPKHLRFSSFFFRSNSKTSFAALYLLNQIYRRLWPENANVIRK